METQIPKKSRKKKKAENLKVGEGDILKTLRITEPKLGSISTGYPELSLKATMQIAPQAEKSWWPTTRDERRGRGSSRAKPELRAGTSPRSACSAFCLLRRRPAQNVCCAAGRENLVADEHEALRGRRESRAKPELSRLRTRSPHTP
jgi:hypothetical protein